MTRRTARKLRTLARTTAVVCCIAPIFNVLTSEASWGEALQGIIDALVAVPLLGGWLLFVRDGALRAWFRRRSFLSNLALNTLALLVLFLLARSIGQLATGGPSRALASFLDPHLAWAIPFAGSIAFVLLFVLQMNRMIGTDVLRYFVTGVYHRPTEEDRIFLFLDLQGSTRLAEQLGSAVYFELLRRFVDDLSEPILESGGSVYQYAGDEVVVVWSYEDGVRDASCVRCFFEIREAIARRAAEYQKAFGTVPEFRAGLHGGTVVAGELGDLRQEIVFVGDTLNTAARLEEYARAHGLGLVVSGSLLASLTLPDRIAAELCEELVPRGKQEKVAVYSLREREREPDRSLPSRVSNPTPDPSSSDHAGSGSATRSAAGQSTGSLSDASKYIA